jgi:hypothetical protein
VTLKQLFVLGWVVFALNLAVFGMMVRELLVADFAARDSGADELVFAQTMTLAMAIWLCFINLMLVIGWWRASRMGLWLAVVCGIVPVLWAWSVAVQVITEWAAAPQ